MSGRLRWMLGALLALSPGVSAAAGLDLAWNTCATDGGVTDLSFDCADPDFDSRLIGTFATDVQVSDVVQFDYVIDLQVDAVELPDFWIFQDSAPIPFPPPPWLPCNGAEILLGGCLSTTELWPPVPTGGIDFKYIWHVGGVPNRGRFTGSLHPTVSRPATVLPNVKYWGVAIHFITAYAEQCSGCSTPVTFVFNQATLHSSQGPPVVITGPGFVSNCATANGGGNVPCGATPAKRSTWGTIKALYR